MTCEYFGKCGSCTLYDTSYIDGLNSKIEIIKNNFSNLYSGEFEVFKSDTSNFRARAEFRIWHIGDDISYSMNTLEKKSQVQISTCHIVIKEIQELLKPLLDYIQKDLLLSHKLFTIEFLSSINKDTLVTLIYHKALNDEWKERAKSIEKEFGIKVIGRSRKQKLTLTSDYIVEKLNVNNRDFFYTQYESSFTQPNPKVNEQMLEWARSNSVNNGKDLLELYCGNGNFTMVLSQNFDKVLATEISKSSIKSATQNIELNKIDNIEFTRMSSEEFVEAIEKKREFKRLKDKNIDLDSYDFSTIFLDPPRAGLDTTTTQLAQKFENILYISCNPTTLNRDLQEISKTHKIEKFALFDQFAYTNHLECGVKLTKI
jgi:tRNA (uracil-5-)-methyltransferase